MRSITVGQAALLAAVALVVLALFDLADNTVLLAQSPLLVVLGSTVPTLVWAGFFFRMYRNFSSARIAAWLALIFALLLESLIAYLRFQEAVSYWTPFGSALSLYGWLLRIGWAVFLIAFAIAPNRPHTGKVARALAIVSAPMALSVAYDFWNGGVGVLLGGPLPNFWRVLIMPGVHALYWISQILFLWTFGRDRA